MARGWPGRVSSVATSGRRSTALCSSMAPPLCTWRLRARAVLLSLAQVHWGGARDHLVSRRFDSRIILVSLDTDEPAYGGAPRDACRRVGRRDPRGVHGRDVGERGPARWNRHVATLRSFTAFARRHGWLPGDPSAVLERRTEPADRTRAIARSSLERMFAAKTSRCARNSSGGCYTKPPLEHRKCSAPTSQTSTSTTSAYACGARAATATGCTFKPAPHACYPGCSATATPPDLPRRPPPEPRPSPRLAGPMPDHRTRPPVLPTIRVHLQAALAEGEPNRVDAASAAPLRPDAPRRRRVNLPF